MNALDDPTLYERGRDLMFFEAKRRVEEQFPDASIEAKMGLIGAMIKAHAILIGTAKLAEDISSSSGDISAAIHEQIERG